MRSRSVEVLPLFGDDATGIVEAEDHALIQDLVAPKRLLADKALDADKLRLWLKTRPIKTVILSTASGAKPYPLDRTAYKRRNVIERLFCCLKNWRRIATRYDRLAEYYLAVIALDKRLGEKHPRFRRIACSQGELFISLADQLSESIWNALSKPINAGIGMLVRASHRKDHMYHRSVPVRR
jgi:transposase